MALILTTRPHDGPIHIFDDESGKKIGEVNLLNVKGCQARLAFEMDDTVTVLRDKVLKEKNND